MITLEMEQQTAEWYSAKLGIPSASNFDKIVTSKGEPSKSRTKYLYQLAAERITGAGEESFKSKYMDRGTETEAEARSFYEFYSGETIHRVGMCFQDSKRLFSCSPDGLVGRNGGVEIKCPSSAVHIEYLLGEKLPTTYFEQVQGSLKITGRKWWDFISYYPGLKPLIVRVLPDAEFIKKLDSELKTFCIDLEKVVLQLS